MEYTISRTIQARSFEPVQYTVTGSTPQEAIDGLRAILKDYPPNPHPKAVEGDTDQINKEFALASNQNTTGQEDQTSHKSPMNSGLNSTPEKNATK